MNNRISKLIPLALMIAAVAWLTGPMAAPQASSAVNLQPAPATSALASTATALAVDPATSGRVWHIRPPHVMGDEVLALYGEPGFGGYMFFLRGDAIVREIEEGVYELRPEKIAAKIHEKADVIAASGYLMLDAEGPLSDPDNLPLYIEMAKVARAALRKEGLYDIKLGIFRIPDHGKDNVANKFAFIRVLEYLDAVFVMVKGSNDRWADYIKDVVQVAPEHAHVWYLDAYSRVDGQPYSQKQILDTVRLAERLFRDAEIGFRQEGPHVAQAIKWVLAWRGHPEVIIE